MAGIIFLLRHVMMGSIQQLERFANATPAGHMQIDADVVMDILAVIDGGALDLVNGAVNFVDGMLFFVVNAVIRANFGGYFAAGTAGSIWAICCLTRSRPGPGGK